MDPVKSTTLWLVTVRTVERRCRMDTHRCLVRRWCFGVKSGRTRLGQIGVVYLRDGLAEHDTHTWTTGLVGGCGATQMRNDDACSAQPIEMWMNMVGVCVGVP